MEPQDARTLVEPLHQSVLVRSGRAHTFGVFVERLGDWWPVETHRMGEEKVVEVRFERDLGGRVYEIGAGGTECTWGEVIVWEPPERFAITWRTLSEVTEVEVRFKELGPALTRVELEHRGWERLTAEEISAWRDSYTRGWKLILGQFADAAAAGNYGN